ncbi:MAG: hypothetical protein WCR47_09705, partial [Desulfoplanes sp.]
YGMDLVEQRFNDKVFAFADSLGYQRECLEASAIVSQANRDLSKAREDRATLIKIEREEKERKEEIRNAGITMKTAQEQLAGLRAQAGVATDDALEKAGEDSRNKRALQEKIEALEQELTRNGDGLSLKELEEEFEASDIDLLDDALERISVELNEYQEKRDMLRDQRQTIQNEIAAKDGSSTAAQALEEAEQQLAAMGSGVEKYLRLQIARLILEQQIEDYRKKNQAPVLARAGELFAKLTLGSYVNLRDELDNAGKPVLLGVRPNNDEVPIDGMSEGTRDQLYLALRLATLEQHLSKGEPIPFIVDDILIGFDDNRTMVCLEILAELAVRTQVLLFTHHKRVLELAQSIHVQAGLYTHEL